VWLFVVVGVVLIKAKVANNVLFYFYYNNDERAITKFPHWFNLKVCRFLCLLVNLTQLEYTLAPDTPTQLTLWPELLLF